MVRDLHPDAVWCLACGKVVPDGGPTFPDVSGFLCSDCAPRVSDLMLPNDGSFVDVDSGEPLSAEDLRAWHDRIVAGGAKPDDSLARWP